MKLRLLIAAAAIAVTGCNDADQDPEEPEIDLPRVKIYGLVYDAVGTIHPSFTVTYQPTADAQCAGSSLGDDVSTFVGTSGTYRMEIEQRGACARLIINAIGQPTIPDTIRRTDLPFRMGSPDSVRIDAVLGRTDLVIVRERAMLGTGNPGTIAVVVPDTVTRNQPFTVTSSHHGSSSCTTLDTVEVVYNGNTATLSPFVLERRTGGCTLDLHTFTQSAQITFTTPGIANVRVVGRDTTVTRTTFVR